jgi:hypothetical protein
VLRSTSKCSELLAIFSFPFLLCRKRTPAKKTSPPYTKYLDVKIESESEPVDSSSLLSSPLQVLQDKNKKQGRIAGPIVEISSDEDGNATPTPKAKK